MATVRWVFGLDGDWHTDANWSAGTMPTASDDVVIDAAGSSYRIALTTAAAARSLTVDAFGARLSQAANAPLTLGAGLTVDDGTVILRAANAIGGTVDLFNGEIEVGNNLALGSAAIDISFGQLVAISNVALGNAITVHGIGYLGATAGTTLHVTGAFSTTASAVVNFGDFSDTGTIDFSPASVSAGASPRVYVNDPLHVGNVNINALLSSAADTFLNPDGVLDVAGHSLEILQLHGSGGVINSGGAANLKLDSGNYIGAISGALSVEIDGAVTFAGASTYSGTTTIDPAGNLQLGSVTAGSVAGAIVDNGILTLHLPGGTTFANNISGIGRLALSGTSSADIVRINHANAFSGGASLSSGTLGLGNAGGLGAGAIQITFAELAATQSETVTNALSLNGDATISAFHGKTLTLNSAWTIADITDVVFGSAGHDGTVIAQFEGLTQGGLDRFFINGGTLKAADNQLGGMLEAGSETFVGAGAKLDANGFFLGASGLRGSGTITNSGAAHEFDVFGGDFGGTITGALKAVFAGSPTILTGTNTYTGGTTIESSGALALGDGGTTGTITGSIEDKGVLAIDHSNAVALTQLISGAGSLQQRGSGETTLSRHNTYSGGTTIIDGTLASAHGGALGTGGLTMAGGELLATVTQSMTNTLRLSGNDTLAAASGKTLTISAAWLVQSDAAITFGAAGETGTVVARVIGETLAHPYSMTVKFGTLKLGDINAGVLVGQADHVAVQAGATLDLNGFASDALDLHGGGLIRSTGAAVFEIVNGSFSGKINGAIALQIIDDVTLSGGGSFSGGALVETNAKLHLINAAAENITFGSNNNASLILDTPNQFTGTISDMIQTDKIDLTTVAFGGSTHLSFNAATDRMTVTDGTHTVHLQFEDGYHPADFAIVNDGHGHTFVETSVTVAPAMDPDAFI